jgi:hypothetical protein
MVTRYPALTSENALTQQKRICNHADAKAIKAPAAAGLSKIPNFGSSDACGMIGMPSNAQTSSLC